MRWGGRNKDAAAAGHHALHRDPAAPTPGTDTALTDAG